MNPDISRAAARVAARITPYTDRLAFAEAISDAQTLDDVPEKWRAAVADAMRRLARTP